MKKSSFLTLLAMSILSLIPTVVSAQSLKNPMQWYSDATAREAERARRDEEGTPQERAALAEEIVTQREQDSGRAFDPTVRTILLSKLAGKSAGALRQMKLTPAPMNVGDSNADLSFTPLTPCRIIDTRSGGGAIAAGSTRNFVVAGTGTTTFTSQGGTSGGCGVPVGATSVLINFVAVNPQGAGNLKGAAFPNSIPATGSIVNYQALTPALNIANGVAFPICDPSVTTCTFDLTLLANVAGTDVVADVLGYFSRFKKEEVRSFTLHHEATGGSAYTVACTNVGTSLAVTAPVAGRIHAHANVLVEEVRASGTAAGQSTEYESFLATGPTTCNAGFGSFEAPVYEPIVAGTYFRTIPLDLEVDVAAGSTTTFYVNGMLFSQVSGDSAFPFASGIVATFFPN